MCDPGARRPQVESRNNVDTLSWCKIWLLNGWRQRLELIRDSTDPRGNRMQPCRQASSAKITDIFCEWTSGQKQHLCKQCQKIQCCTENHAPNDSSSSTTSTSLTSLTEVSTDDSSSSPATTPNSSSLGTWSRYFSKKTTQKRTGSLVARFSRMVGRLHRKSSGGRSASIKRCNREHFS